MGWKNIIKIISAQDTQFQFQMGKPPEVYIVAILLSVCTNQNNVVILSA